MLQKPKIRTSLMGPWLVCRLYLFAFNLKRNVTHFFCERQTRSFYRYTVKLLTYPSLAQVLRLEPYMGEDVPVRWFNFERVVEALVQQKTFYLKVSQLYNVVRKMCFIEDELEMVAMLDFYHDLGIIIWHGDTVVLQTQWLIHLFRKLITIRPFDEQV